MLTAYFEVIQEHFFREVTFSIFDQRDGQKDDVTMVKKDQVCCLKDGTDGVVSTASTTTSNRCLLCIATTSLVRMTGEGIEAAPRPLCAKARMLKPFSNQTIDRAG